MKVSTPKMIEMLTENPDRKAVREDDSLPEVKYCPDYGFYYNRRKLCVLVLDSSFVNSMWQIIDHEHGPVYFMEAFKAWQEQDKEIICKDSEGRTLDRLCPAAKNVKIKARHILEGAWYIKDYTGREE